MGDFSGHPLATLSESGQMQASEAQARFYEPYNAGSVAAQLMAFHSWELLGR